DGNGGEAGAGGRGVLRVNRDRRGRRGNAAARDVGIDSAGGGVPGHRAGAGPAEAGPGGGGARRGALGGCGGGTRRVGRDADRAGGGNDLRVLDGGAGRRRGVVGRLRDADGHAAAGQRHVPRDRRGERLGGDRGVVGRGEGDGAGRLHDLVV